MRALAAGALGLAVLAAILGFAIVASAISVLGVGGGPYTLLPTSHGGGVGTGSTSIPPAMIALYQEAAATCAGLPWTVLAAIGTIESDYGQSDLPGVHSGANAADVEGPMQFEPATF